MPMDRWTGNLVTLARVPAVVVYSCCCCYILRHSALLDEDICFECGQPSTSAAWNEIILCDICDGEFHLACAQLEQPPRSGWRCSHCMDEIARFKDLKYNLPNGLFRVSNNNNLYILYNSSDDNVSADPTGARLHSLASVLPVEALGARLAGVPGEGIHGGEESDHFCRHQVINALC